MFESISSFLVLHTSHGLWDWAGALGAFVLGITAIFGGFVALKSFLASTQAASHAHMHHMFLSFLESRNKLAVKLSSTEDAEEKPIRKASSLREDLDFGGSALYFLEEVCAWTVTEERLANRWWLRPLVWQKERRRRLDVIKSWRSTIIAQLITHKVDVLSSLKGYSSCYGADFLAFAALTLSDEKLRDIAARSMEASLAGQPRPMGIMEKRTQRLLAHRSILLDGLDWRDRAVLSPSKPS